MSVKLDARVLKELLKATSFGSVARWVHDGVEYGVFQELGTDKMAAHPFMRPAIEANRRSFEQAFRGAGDRGLFHPVDIVEKVAFDVLGEAQIRCPVDTGALVNSLSVSEDKPS